MAWTTPITWVAGQVVTAATMNAQVSGNLNFLNAGVMNPSGAWTAYTPTLTASTTNPTLGTGSSQAGRWAQSGKFVTGQFDITFGTSGVAAGSGTYQISVPTSIGGNYNGAPFGRCVVFNAATFGYFDLLPGSSSFMIVRYPNAWPTGGLTTVTSAIPGAWTTSNYIRGTFCYEAV